MQENTVNLPAEMPSTTEVLENPVVAARESLLDSYRQYYKMANEMSRSELVPQNFRGKPMDIAIAFDMASRMGVSPLVVMQNLCVVKGKPSWSGQACISFIKARYSDVRHIYIGEEGKESFGCYVEALTPDGEVVKGPRVTLKMARAEGWTSNSKWSNMPELMLAYRAAAFFARVHCPDILMGASVEGETEAAQVRIAEDVL